MLPVRKNAVSSASPGSPRPQVTPAPTAQAATSPPGVSHFTRRAARPGSGASGRGVHPGPGSGPGGNRGTAFRSRIPRRTAGSGDVLTDLLLHRGRELAVEVLIEVFLTFPTIHLADPLMYPIPTA